MKKNLQEIQRNEEIYQRGLQVINAVRGKKLKSLPPKNFTKAILTYTNKGAKCPLVWIIVNSQIDQIPPGILTTQMLTGVVDNRRQNGFFLAYENKCQQQIPTELYTKQALKSKDRSGLHLLHRAINYAKDYPFDIKKILEDPEMIQIQDGLEDTTLHVLSRTGQLDLAPKAYLTSENLTKVNNVGNNALHNVCALQSSDGTEKYLSAIPLKTLHDLLALDYVRNVIQEQCPTLSRKLKRFKLSKGRRSENILQIPA